MRPLVLSGKALSVQVDAKTPSRGVFRLVVASQTGSLGPNDAMLCKPGTQAAPGAPLRVEIGAEAPLPPSPAVIRLSNDFDYLEAGDVVAVHFETGRVRTLYRKASRHNSFLTTEQCNHYCLMCSQPPKSADDTWLLDEIAEALPLMDPATPYFGFTGGEPLLHWRRLVELVRLAAQHLPHTALHVLTNGRAFADPQIADAWAGAGHPNLSAGIPIYAAVDSLHDHVVQAKGAFDETVLGILRLAERNQRIEIRVVVHRLTAPRLVQTATWLARNLPFVDHVALMGLENTGFAIANDAMLWIDPIEYREELARAVDILSTARVPTSVYNLPYCVLAPSVWPFAAQSISDWKNAYLPQCDACAAKAHCAGFFSSGRPRQSRAIEPLAAFEPG